jgi:mycothiol synthase
MHTTGNLTITALDPSGADEADVHGVHAVWSAAVAFDKPEFPAVTLEFVVGMIRDGAAGPIPRRYWLAWLADGRPAAVAMLMLPKEENTSHALIDVRVHPEVRRQGVATEVFPFMLASARSAGRTRILTAPIREGGGGVPWVTRLGFEQVQANVVQQLDLTTADPALWDVPTAPGYRLVEWIAAAPEDLIASYARARGAISDAPSGTTTWDDPQWTPERVRVEEAGLLAENTESRVVVAVHEATGEVAGVSELYVLLRDPGHLWQGDTAVLAAHRGHGLGRSIKAAMLRRLLADRPDAKLVTTQTATTNVYMANVNHQIGFRTAYTQIYAEADVEALEKRLG